MSDTWADDDGALEFAKSLKRKHQAAMELLVSAASKSTDPHVRQAWGSMKQLEQVIEELELERGKHRK